MFSGMLRVLVTSMRRVSSKPGFHVARKIEVFIKKSVERKLKNLEIKFLFRKCQLWPYLCECNWKNELIFGGG